MAPGKDGSAIWRAASATALSSSSGSVSERSEKPRRSPVALTPNCAPRSAQASLSAF
jgi:hypothetical protein